MGFCKHDELCKSPFNLLNEANEACLEMHHQALMDGVHLHGTSGYRSFFQQSKIWENKFWKLKTETQLNPFEIVAEIIKISAIPGTSRHHWGTDIDFVDAFAYQLSNPLDSTQYKPGGEYAYLNHWLQNHAEKFGFYQVYTLDNTRSGFEHEPWHYSYKPLAVKYLKICLDIPFHTHEAYLNMPGNEVFYNKNYFENYKKTHILGINPNLI